MKKKSSTKKMAKTQNSYSENFIKRLRHSRQSQMLSTLIVVSGLIGLYLVLAVLLPTNYGSNDSQPPLASRRNSFHEQVGFRLGDAFNRLNFVVMNDKKNPEWVSPDNLPIPESDVILSLPDSSIFGDVHIQSQVNVSETEKNLDTAEKVFVGPNDPEPIPTEKLSEEELTKRYGTDEDTGDEDSGLRAPVNAAEMNICVYERDEA